MRSHLNLHGTRTFDVIIWRPFFAFIVGMEGIDCDRAVDLSKYIDTSQYTIYQGVHARMTSQYFYASRKKKTKTSVAARNAVVENPNPGC